jgi:uncharacterized protein DUF1344
MKRLLMLTALLTVTALVVPTAWAEDIQGKIKSVDQTGRILTLEDGTQLMLPPTVRINRDNMTPGADVKASYQTKGDQKVVTSIEVHPAK